MNTAPKIFNYKRLTTCSFSVFRVFEASGNKYTCWSKKRTYIHLCRFNAIQGTANQLSTLLALYIY